MQQLKEELVASGCTTHQIRTDILHPVTSTSSRSSDLWASFTSKPNRGWTGCRRTKRSEGFLTCVPIRHARRTRKTVLVKDRILGPVYCIAAVFITIFIAYRIVFEKVGSHVDCLLFIQNIARGWPCASCISYTATSFPPSFVASDGCGYAGVPGLRSRVWFCQACSQGLLPWHQHDARGLLQRHDVSPM